MSEALDERHALKDRVLEAALQHAAFDGWSRRTLANAATDAGIDAATARRLFPQAGDSLLEWLADWADRRMLQAVGGQDLLNLPVRARVAKVVRARFDALAPYRESIRRAVVARTLPHNLGPGGRSLWRTVDLIWDVVGMAADPAERWSRYTRRLSLAGLLASVTLYWLEDTTDGQAATWAFLDRRIEDLLRVGRLRAQLQEMLRVVSGMRPSPKRQ